MERLVALSNAELALNFESMASDPQNALARISFHLPKSLPTPPPPHKSLQLI